MDTDAALCANDETFLHKVLPAAHCDLFSFLTIDISCDGLPL